MNQSIFTKIANKEIPANIVLENEKYMAILDIKPLTEGMTVVFPKENIGSYLYDLELKEYLLLMQFTQEVAKKLKSKLNVDKIITLVEGYEVDHVHIKLLPSNSELSGKIRKIEITNDYFETIMKKLS